MDFESLPTTPRADELLDTAFSRAARAGRAKSGVDAQDSMLLTASNVLSDNLSNVVTAWPDFNALDPFYRDLADAVIKDLDGVGSGGVPALQQHLSNVQWAAEKTKELGRDYQRRIAGKDPATARKFRKQAFARMADVVGDVEDDLSVIGTARDALRVLPAIDPDAPTIVVAGYPNVGKSSFVNAVTTARNETAEYPFTTQGVGVGHVEAEYIRYQIVDTPGLLDRPMVERNEIEQQAVTAIDHLADCIIFLIDPSETCGYTLEVQQALRDDLDEQFDADIITVGSKADLSTATPAEYYISITDNDAMAGRKSADTGRHVTSLTDVLQAAIDAIDYAPDLPLEES